METRNRNQILVFYRSFHYLKPFRSLILFCVGTRVQVSLSSLFCFARLLILYSIHKPSALTERLRRDSITHRELHILLTLSFSLSLSLLTEKDIVLEGEKRVERKLPIANKKMTHNHRAYYGAMQVTISIENNTVPILSRLGPNQPQSNSQKERKRRKERKEHSSARYYESKN